MKKIILSLTLLISSALFANSVQMDTIEVDADHAPKISKQQAKQYMKQSMGYLDKELKMKISGLSKQTKGTLLNIYTHHDRHSQKATLRQVMQEVGREYETMLSGLMMNNPEMAGDAARRLANHRIPRGGLISYLKLSDINDDMLSGLDAMNSAVEGNAIKFAKATDKGDMLEAAKYLTPIANGCISCHAVFRGKPGTNSHIR
jgi:hypothetical protein